MQVELFPVIVAGITSMVIGSTWYSPQVFGTMWSRFTGVRMDQVTKAQMAQSMVAGLIGMIVTAYVLSYLFLNMGISTIQEAVRLTGILWLGFVATILAGVVLWERKPVTFYILNAAHWLVVMLAMAVIVISV